MLSGQPGGPARPEARRRLAQGLPLVVGLSLADTEGLQDRLVDAGLVPRLGPAPPGTPPLREPRGRRRTLRAALALVALSLLGLGYLALRTPSPQPTPAPAPSGAPSAASSAAPTALATPTPAAAASPFQLWCQPEKDRAGLVIVGAATIRTLEVPVGDLLLTLTDAGSGATLSTSRVPAAGARRYALTVDDTPQEILTLPFRVRVPPEAAGQRELALTAEWGTWRTSVSRIRLP